MSVASDTPAALAWLRALEPDGPWLLAAINPIPVEGERNADFVEFGPSSESECAAWIGARQGSRNLYYTSNLPAWSPFKSTKKETIRYLRLLHVDIDLPGDAADAEGADVLLARLRSLSPPPTAIVFSGGGYQAIWKFPERQPVVDNNYDPVEVPNRAITDALRADHCHDASRLLRLPGTVNLPNATKLAKGRVPVLSHLVEADWSRTWRRGRDPIPKPPDEAPLPEPKPGKSGEVSGVLDTLPATLRKLIKSGDPTNFKNAQGKPDRSRLGWYVMCEIIRLGWSDEDAAPVFLDQANGVAAHYLDQSNPAAYVARNLRDARGKVALDWKRHPRTREILVKDQDNLDRVMAHLGVKLTYDELADRVWVNGAGPLRRYSDDVRDKLLLQVQKDCGFLPDERFFKKFLAVRARERSYHPVLDYLAHVQPTWDGVLRLGSATDEVPSWLTTYGGAEDTPYTRAVGRLTLVAGVRRMRRPGCKFDEMLMLVSAPQGTNKSSAVRALAVNDDWFNDYLPLGEAGREVIEHVRGFWIIEAAEVAGLTSRDVERIKGFCSRQNDRGRMSYDETVSDVPRSCIFIGTTNEEALFTDMLNRRFWPVGVSKFDVDRLVAVRDQLWAEAAVAEAAGESIRLAEDLWPAAAAVQELYRVEEAWSAIIEESVGDLNGRVSSPAIYRILNKAAGNVLHTDGRRLGKAMRELGFEHRQHRAGALSRPRWFYERGTEEERKREIYVFRDPTTGAVTVGHHPPRGDYGDEPIEDQMEVPF